MQILSAEKYNIEIGSITQSSFENFIEHHYKHSKIIIIVDENSNDCCLEYLITTFEFLAEAEVMLLPAGEENKVMEVCFQVWEAMSEYGVTRKDLVINLGGGVITDIGGFLSSIYKRGVDCIHIPTTLLAMVDASIGGKTGIDLGSYKNQLGTFKDPVAVYIDPIFLKTLHVKEILNGYAEMLKHALIGDADQWEFLRSINDLSALFNEAVIIKSLNLKNSVVQEDPLEKGKRKILNFGHTAGHALEGYLLSKVPIDHGHAVALGMVVESYISMRKNLLSKSEFEEIEKAILDWFPIYALQNTDIGPILELLKNDKKNHSGKIQCCLLRRIGECEYDQPVEEHEFKDGFLHLMNRNLNLN